MEAEIREKRNKKGKKAIREKKRKKKDIRGNTRYLDIIQIN